MFSIVKILIIVQPFLGLSLGGLNVTSEFPANISFSPVGTKSGIEYFRWTHHFIIHLEHKEIVENWAFQRRDDTKAKKSRLSKEDLWQIKNYS